MRWQLRTLKCDGRTWSDLVDTLAELLRLRAEAPGRFLILSMNHHFRFVQFRTGGAPGSVRCETISNHLLTGSQRLSRSTRAALVSLGWKPPRLRDRHFWRVYRAGTTPRHAAAFAVRTLRNVFGASAPASLHISCNSASLGFGAPASSAESGLALPMLPKGAQVINRATGRGYRVDRQLGQGGFGVVYRVTQTMGAPKFPGRLCLKIAAHPEAWHREAYFGQLLEGVPRAIAVHDSFAVVEDWLLRENEPLYCLVTELAEHGDLDSYLRRRRTPWTERRACREVAEILRVLVHLHGAGAVHRDVTPSNVLVTKGEHLKLGDFGIARHGLQGRVVPADAFNPGFAPDAVAYGRTRSWRSADDVYQMGSILTALLGGSTVEKSDSADAKNLHCSPGLKAVIQRAIGDRRKRYVDAAAMLEAIEARDKETPTRVPLPTSLRGRSVVFTGVLSIPRRQAVLLARRRGAQVQAKVTSVTDILVQGTAARVWKADLKGQKLLDVDRERELGHHICVINEREFMTLLGRPPR